GPRQSKDAAHDQAGITVTLPKPMTSSARSDGRFGKQDFVYLPDEDRLERLEQSSAFSGLIRRNTAR
ncbi:hypothetical protein J4G37_61770, partial [Microvirga sp. 3-52]|nr:hypothetical protein [Microvirga sp. 3-52]